MNIPSPFTREFWIDDRLVREAVGPLPKSDAINQAHYSAMAVERDRELYADLLRQQREKRIELSRIDDALEELDALRILETAT